MLNKTALGVAISAALSISVSAAEQTIEKITVTANKFEQPINDVLASVAVIDRADIEKANYRDLPAILNTLMKTHLMFSRMYVHIYLTWIYININHKPG